MQRVRELEEDVEVLAIKFGKKPTYYNAVRLQLRQAEREVLIEELRAGIRVVVDNSEFWE